MPNKLSYIFIALAILINTLSASTLELTKQEKAFIKAHPTIILGTDKSWIPYVVINKDGSITGYDQEVLNRINQLTGSNFKLKASKWSEVVIEAKNKVIDGLSTGSIQEERSKYLNFSAPYVKIKYIFLTSRSEKKTSLKNIDDIDGHTIGIQKGNLVTKQIIKKFKNLKVIEYDNYSEIIKTVITDEVDLVLIADHLSIFYRVSEFKIPFLRPIALLDKETNLVFSVRKDYPEAISIINKALDYMGEKELKKIKNKYFRGSLYESTKTSVFKQEELSYLSNKKEIKMCIDPNWMPLEKIAQGKAIGYTSDFMQLVGDKINIPINLVATKTWSESLKNMENRLCDIIPIVAHTPKFEKHMDFTSPYLSIQVVLATKASVIYINDLENQLDKTFAVVKNYALNTYLKSKYPTLKIVNVDSIHDGLVKVVNEEVFGYIDNSAVIRHAIQRDFFSTLAITGKIDLEMHYSVGTRNDEKILNSIFEKATSSINNSDKQDIKNRWFSFKQSPKIDYDLLRKIISIFVIITTFLFISRKKNQKLKIAQEKIEEFNLTLQEQVETEVERNKQQELLMFQQSRLAQMGEMINMIAHQWRQPLSTINGLVMVMDMKRSKQNLENRLFLEEEFNEIESLTAHMSDTIDDFRNFFKPEKQKIKFQLKDNIEHAIGLVRPVLSHKNILISTRYQKNVELLGYPNEFGQVIVNIINNAKDALLMDTENKIKEIYIQLSTKNQSVILSIEDNAKGISEELLPHIFDPYFSTKSEKNGTGLGLYISKMIIEEHMGGELYVENTSLGAKFTIKFNLSNANNK